MLYCRKSNHDQTPRNGAMFSLQFIFFKEIEMYRLQAQVTIADRMSFIFLVESSASFRVPGSENELYSVDRFTYSYSVKNFLLRPMLLCFHAY